MKGLRVRQIIRLGKYVRINLSKSGSSLSIGRSGATVNIKPGKTTGTIGVPGSGASLSKTVPRRETDRIEPTFSATRPDYIDAPVHRPKRGRKIMFGVLGLMVLGVVVTAVHDFGKTPEQIAAEREAYDAAEQKRQRVGIAEVTCQREAERRANDPASIDWLRSEREFAYKNKEQTRAISRQPMRARNGFGAVVRSTVVCDLKRVGDSWEAVRLSTK